MISFKKIDSIFLRSLGSACVFCSCHLGLGMEPIKGLVLDPSVALFQSEVYLVVI